MPCDLIIGHGSGLAGISHQFAKRLEAWIIRIDVHVSSEDHRITFRIHRADTFD